MQFTTTMVDLKRLELSTSRMRTERSPKLSYRPENMNIIAMNRGFVKAFF